MVKEGKRKLIFTQSFYGAANTNWRILICKISLGMLPLQKYFADAKGKEEISVRGGAKRAGMWQRAWWRMGGRARLRTMGWERAGKGEKEEMGEGCRWCQRQSVLHKYTGNFILLLSLGLLGLALMLHGQSSAHRVRLSLYPFFLCSQRNTKILKAW